MSCALMLLNEIQKERETVIDTLSYKPRRREEPTLLFSRHSGLCWKKWKINALTSFCVSIINYWSLHAIGAVKRRYKKERKEER